MYGFHLLCAITMGKHHSSTKSQGESDAPKATLITFPSSHVKASEQPSGPERTVSYVHVEPGDCDKQGRVTVSSLSSVACLLVGAVHSRAQELTYSCSDMVLSMF